MAAECLNPQQNTNQTIFTHLYAATAREACVCNMEKLPKYQHTQSKSVYARREKIPQQNRASHNQANLLVLTQLNLQKISIREPHLI